MRNNLRFSKGLFTLLISLLCYSQCFSQKASAIYNEHGQLMACKSVSITAQQLKKFKSVEDTILYQILDTLILPKFGYPNVQFLSGTWDSLMIASFKIKGDSIQFDSIVKFSYDYKLAGFEKLIKNKLNHIKLPHSPKGGRPIPDNAKYYLPFSWKLTNFCFDVKKDGLYLSERKITVVKTRPATGLR